MSRSLRILVIASTLPYPPDAGSSIRIFNLIRHLARRHEVTLLAHAVPQEAWKVEALEEQGIRVRTVPAPSRLRAPDLIGSVSRPQALGATVRRLAQTFLPSSYQGSYAASRQLGEAVARLTSEGQFDVVQLESSELCRLVAPIRRSTAVVVVDEHNIEYELRHRIAQAQRSKLKALNNRLEASKFEREERRCWAGVDGCVLVSERDRAVVARAAPRLATAVVANGADLEAFAPEGPPPGAPPTLTFVGRLDYRPNADGVLWFAGEILPIIRRSHRVDFTIVGGGAPAEVRALAAHGVELTGRVPDARPYVARAAVVPVPLRMGGGTRIKILEALAMARPVVSTTIGAEGLDVVHGEHLLIADDPAGFASAIVRLLADPDAAEAMGRRGRALVERRYDWAASALRLEQFYESLVAGRRPAPAA